MRHPLGDGGGPGARQILRVIRYRRAGGFWLNRPGRIPAHLGSAEVDVEVYKLRPGWEGLGEPGEIGSRSDTVSSRRKTWPHTCGGVRVNRFTG